MSRAARTEAIRLRSQRNPSADIIPTPPFLSYQEKKLWHSHFFEIRTGLWILPGVPSTAERGLLPKMAKTYGKFWNTWQTDKHSLPLGVPALMTSPQEHAPVPPELVAARDKRYGISTQETEEERRVSARTRSKLRRSSLRSTTGSRVKSRRGLCLANEPVNKSAFPANSSNGEGKIVKPGNLAST